ncbi:cytidylate kinase [[Eubacterium] yurii subsp. margaretiae ATCC 43715]|nr:cytidylate kinase [[Eubacterium] yurii subsp. margaretiae ATCC 43715]
MIIAFDGPAGSGKSTVAKIISEKLGITYLDTGAMYRAVTLYFLENNVDFNDENQVKINLEKIELEFINDKLYLNNKDVSVQIREKNVNDNVSFVSAIRIVREKMVDLQRKMSGKKSVVLDGRDIGTVVFPNADYKFYVTASVDVRARRRYEEELQKGKTNISFDEVKKSMENRDYIDSNREVTPLKKADDAIEIDTSGMSIEQVLEKILSYIK